MADQQMTQEIVELVAKVIKRPADKLKLSDDLFADLGVDSLLGVEIFAALDKKFNLDIPEAKVKELSTLGDLVKLVKNLA